MKKKMISYYVLPLPGRGEHLPLTTKIKEPSHYVHALIASIELCPVVTSGLIYKWAVEAAFAWATMCTLDSGLIILRQVATYVVMPNYTSLGGALALCPLSPTSYLYEMADWNVRRHVTIHLHPAVVGAADTPSTQCLRIPRLRPATKCARPESLVCPPIGGAFPRRCYHMSQTLRRTGPAAASEDSPPCAECSATSGVTPSHWIPETGPTATYHTRMDGSVELNERVRVQLGAGSAVLPLISMPGSARVASSFFCCVSFLLLVCTAGALCGGANASCHYRRG